MVPEKKKIVVFNKLFPAKKLVNCCFPNSIYRE